MKGGNLIFDHPKVRMLSTCVECRGAKEQGLLLCWMCHRKMKRLFDGGYDPVVLACFELIDRGKVRVIEQGDEKGRIVAV